jgi:hypothetical protein
MFVFYNAIGMITIITIIRLNQLYQLRVCNSLKKYYFEVIYSNSKYILVNFLHLKEDTFIQKILFILIINYLF